MLRAVSSTIAAGRGLASLCGQAARSTVSPRFDEPSRCINSMAEKVTRRVNNGQLRHDEDQIRVAGVLDKLTSLSTARLARQLEAARNASAEEAGDGRAVPGDTAQNFSNDTCRESKHEEKKDTLPSVCGVYMWGSVGTGKTMLLDLFTANLREHGVPVKRAHFHEFMLEVHTKLHEFHQAIPVVAVQGLNGRPVHRQLVNSDEDPIQAVSEVMRRTPEGVPAQVLCFDELHVTDVADAMILSRMFRHIMSQGTLVGFTSNRPPSAQYEGGLAREFFLPFVDLINERSVVLGFQGSQDYRQGEVVEGGGALSPRGLWLEGSAGAAQEQLLWQLEAGERRVEASRPLPLAFGRVLYVPESVLGAGEGSAAVERSAARFTFGELCGSTGCRPGVDMGGALGPNDYTALSTAFSLVHVTGVPKLSSSQRDEARRWVVLLDCLYEARTRLICQAENSIEMTFQSLADDIEAALRERASPWESLAWEERSMTGPGGSRPAGSRQPPPEELDGASTGLLREELLMYKRAASRLYELCRGSAS